MNESDKAAKSEPIKDVTDASKVAPSDTSKSIITNRPMVQDPMVKTPTEDALVQTKTEEPTAEVNASRADKSNIHNSEKVLATTKPDESAPAKAPVTETAPAAAVPDSDDKDLAAASTKANEANKTDNDATAAIQEAELKKSEHESEVEKLIESKKYELPITTSEKRRSTRFVILGLLLAIFLILAWIDIALDAQLIKTDSIKPVTHLFSN